MKLFRDKIVLGLVVVLLLGAFLRFYKLDWGQGLFTHPDEYHIVISANQLSFPNQMHPHFFNYGTVTIYLIYFTKEFFHLLQPTTYNLQPFLIGRFYSALFSTLTILLVYKICCFFMSKKYALLGAFLVALTPGLIQQAHFATPESNLIFFLFAVLLFILNFSKTGKIRQLILSSVFLGFALGVKVSGAVMLLPIMMGILLKTWPSIIKTIKFSLLSLIATLVTLIIVAPFIFLDFSHFLDSFRYESGLAMGQIPVFYTRQFIDTTPFIFQIEKILPFTLGPAILVFGIAGFLLMIVALLKKQIIQTRNTCLAGRQARYIILTTFLILFISNGLLFAKWTRFLSPTFPFFAIFSTFFLYQISQLKIHKLFPIILNTCPIILTIIWTISFMSIYTSPDVRFTASNWLENNTPPTSVFLVEGGNMIDVPQKGNFERISIDFYNMEDDSLIREKVAQALEKSNYFLIQSRRVFANHQRLPIFYPKTAHFYNSLFDGSLGFVEIKEFHVFPNLSILNQKVEFPDENMEETWSVFDHPVIRVFQKNKYLSNYDYVQIMQNL